MSHLLSKVFSIFVGHFCPPGSTSGSSRPKSMRIRIRHSCARFYSRNGGSLQYFNWHGTRGKISIPGFNPGILRQTLILRGNRCSSIEYRTLKKSFRRQDGGEHIYFKCYSTDLSYRWLTSIMKRVTAESSYIYFYQVIL